MGLRARALCLMSGAATRCDGAPAWCVSRPQGARLLHGGEIPDDDVIDKVSDGGDSGGVNQWRWMGMTNTWVWGRWVQCLRGYALGRGEKIELLCVKEHTSMDFEQSSPWDKEVHWASCERSDELLVSDIFTEVFPYKNCFECTMNLLRCNKKCISCNILFYFNAKKIASTDKIICFDRNRKLLDITKIVSKHFGSV